MNKLNEWIALLTNVGLLLGIGLLVYELRQNSVLMQSEIYQQRTANLISVEAMIMESDALAEALAKGSLADNDPSDYSTKERLLIQSFLRSHAYRIDNILHQYELGTLTKEYLQTFECPFALYGEYGARHNVPQAVRAKDRYRKAGFNIRPVREACDGW